MSIKLIISLTIFIISIIALIIVRENEKKEKEEQQNKKESHKEKPKTPPYDIIKDNELLKNIIKNYKKENNFSIPIGTITEEEIKVIDFKNNNNILIIGTTGGGKSVCLSEIIYSLAMTYSKEEIDIVTVDTSLVELSSFNKIPHYLKDTIVDPTNIIEEISILEREADKRIKNHTSKKLIVIIDDLYDITTYDTKIIKKIEYLLSISKESNIYFVLATPTQDIITPSIKDNLEATLYLTLSPGEEKDFSFDKELSEEDLEFLNDTSSLICKEKQTTVKVKVPEVTDKEIKKLKDWFIQNR